MSLLTCESNPKKELTLQAIDDQSMSLDDDDLDTEELDDDFDDDFDEDFEDDLEDDFEDDDEFADDADNVN